VRALGSLGALDAGSVAGESWIRGGGSADDASPALAASLAALHPAAAPAPAPVEPVAEVDASGVPRESPNGPARAGIAVETAAVPLPMTDLRQWRRGRHGLTRRPLPKQRRPGFSPMRRTPPRAGT
jgi:hypothetical protein